MLFRSPWDAGIRDMVNLNGNDQAEVRIHFRSFRGKYVFHCHNVEHEDMAMMSQLEII